MGCAGSTPVVPSDPQEALRQRQASNEANVRLLLSLPPSLRAPFDEFLASTPGFSGYVDGVAFADTIARAWGGVREAVRQRYAACAQRKDPGELSFDGVDCEALVEVMGRSYERFRRRSGHRQVEGLGEVLQGTRAEVQRLRSYHFTAGAALAPLSSAMGVLVRMLALLPFARFLRSTHCERLLLALRRQGAAPLPLSAAAVATPQGSSAVLAPLPVCTGRQLAHALVLARKAASAQQRLPAGKGWEAAAAAARAAWLAEVACVGDTLPCMLTVADMLAPGVHIIYANAAFLETTGYSQAETLGRNCKFLQGPGTAPEAIERLRLAIASGQQCHCELLNYRKDGTQFRNFFTLKPVWEALPKPATPDAPSRRMAFYLGVQFEAQVEGEGGAGSSSSSGAASAEDIPLKILELEALLLTLPSEVGHVF